MIYVLFTKFSNVNINFEQVLYCFNEPQSNPYINATELQYLQQNIPSTRVVNSTQRLSYLSYPWYEILTSPPLWALITATVQHDWQQSLILNEIHTFVHNLRNFNLWHHFWSGLKILLPLLLNWLVSVLAGILSDLLIQRQILSITEVRKIMTLIGKYNNKKIMKEIKGVTPITIHC